MLCYLGLTLSSNNFQLVSVICVQGCEIHSQMFILISIPASFFKIFILSCFSTSDLMIEMEDATNDLSEARIPFLDYQTYTDRNFFLPSKDGTNDTMITGKVEIPEGRKAIVAQALNQFSNLLNSKTFLINVGHRGLIISNSLISSTSETMSVSTCSSSTLWRVAPTSIIAPGVILPLS